MGMKAQDGFLWDMDNVKLTIAQILLTKNVIRLFYSLNSRDVRNTYALFMPNRLFIEEPKVQAQIEE